MLFIRSIQYTEFLWRISHKLFVPTDKPFGLELSEEKNFKVSTNKKQKCLWWQSFCWNKTKWGIWILRVSQTFVPMECFRLPNIFNLEARKSVIWQQTESIATSGWGQGSDIDFLCLQVPALKQYLQDRSIKAYINKQHELVRLCEIVQELNLEEIM